MGRQVLQVTCFWIIIVDVSEENEHDDEDNEEHATIVRNTSIQRCISCIFFGK